MDLYILDSLYRDVEVVEGYSSFIWTERHRDIGDFELITASTLASRRQLVTGLRLGMSESNRVMILETVEDTTDEEGRSILKVKGRSLEMILKNRLAMAALTDLTTNPKWSITAAPANIARQLFHDICVTGILNAGDIIPGILETTIFPADTIAEPSDVITYEIDPTDLYSAIKNLCDQFALGFRLVRGINTSQLYFNIYTGSDRTTQQTSLPAVVFSINLDNLKNTTELTTIALYKNVAYVVSPVGHELVYDLGTDTAANGFDRNVLFVKADDITDTVPATATAKMIQRGKEELAKNRRLSGFDGELSQSGQYKYQVDYYLGDLVEMQNKDGFTTTMQVTEQIFVRDREGIRRYPTLTVNEFITPGSWLSWDYNQVWNDLAADPQTWSEQP
mgnify:CR=1 FL=1